MGTYSRAESGHSAWVALCAHFTDTDIAIILLSNGIHSILQQYWKHVINSKADHCQINTVERSNMNSLWQVFLQLVNLSFTNHRGMKK